LEGEIETHLFLHCCVVWRIWEELLNWVEGELIMPPTVMIHWVCWDGMATSKKVCNGLNLIWHTTFWVI
jgi:hypothetical protein